MRNPVWNVYDEYRTALLNVKYYSYQLSTLQKKNFWIQMILALSSSSTVASIWFFGTWAGGLLWKTFGGIAAILAIYQPIVKPSEQIQALEKRVTLWRTIELDLETLTRKIADAKKYDQALENKFQDIMDRRQNIILSYVDPTVDEILRKKCNDEVNKELPAERFFDPEEVA